MRHPIRRPNADHPHSGRVSGLDAGLCIFDDDAAPGSTPSNAAAVRNTSGAGLLRSTVRPSA